MPTSRNNWSTMSRIIWNVWSPCLWTYKEMFPCFEKLMQSIKVLCLHLFFKSLVTIACVKLANINYSLTWCVEMVEQARALCSHFAKTEHPLFILCSHKPWCEEKKCGALHWRGECWINKTDIRQLEYAGYTPSCLMCATNLNEEISEMWYFFLSANVHIHYEPIKDLSWKLCVQRRIRLQ